MQAGCPPPSAGLGTFRARGEEVKLAVIAALNAGIRHIDTASIYRNEESIAAAILESGIPREQIFLTSKLSPYEVGRHIVLCLCST
jgi:diketogulonate reductase-like aldo/keto reductase